MEKSIAEIFEFKNAPSLKKTPFGETVLVYDNLEQRLSLCTICKKRALSHDLSLVCSLTQNKPDFVEKCKHHDKDEEAIVARNTRTSKKADTSFMGSWKGGLVMSALGFARAAMRAQDGLDIFAIIFMSLGVMWLMVSFMNKDK